MQGIPSPWGYLELGIAGGRGARLCKRQVILENTGLVWMRTPAARVERTSRSPLVF